jgi:uncharacterized protein YndB with AHSA1/START domain
LQYVWITLGVLVGLVVVVVVVVAVWGALLPRTHSCTVAREHAAPAARIWELIRDVEHAARWRPDVRAVEVRERDGDGDGRPIAWTEQTSFGPMPMRIVEEDAPRRMVGRIDTDELPFGGTWTYVVEDLGSGRARLTLTENGEVKNVFFRFLSRHVFGHDKTMRTYQDHVAAELAG